MAGFILRTARVALGCLAFAWLLFTPTDSAAQQSRCADCHFANPDAPGAQHLAEWDRSAHGRNLVGCERCHGGDPTTFEATQAHRTMLSMTDMRSPVHRANLPATCGSCHTGPFVQFQKSRHLELLRSGDANGPTCVTCHGEVAANLPSPKSLENQCLRCHGPNGTAPRPERAASARLEIEGIRDTRTLLREADALIGRVSDTARRDALRDQARQVAVPLEQAADAGHAFVYDQLQERLSTARARLVALLEAIANPTAR
ncbi:MAG: cytochrome c3 family protein [Vicinamibacterales bacterium]